MMGVVWLRNYRDLDGRGTGTVFVRRCNKKKSIRVMDGFACSFYRVVCRGVVRKSLLRRLPR